MGNTKVNFIENEDESSSYLDGLSFMRVESARSEVLVPYEENHKNKQKWLSYFSEPNIFDKIDNKTDH